MKRKYILSLIVLLGLGIVSTLAFSATEIEPTMYPVYSVTEPAPPTEHVTGVTIYPYKGLHGVSMTMTVSEGTKKITLLVQFVDDGGNVIDFSGYSVQTRIGAGSWADAGSWNAEIDAYEVSWASDTPLTSIGFRASKAASFLYTNTEQIVLVETEWS